MTLGDPVDRREEVRIHQDPGRDERERVVVDTVAERRLILYRLSQFVWLLTGILETLIGLRITLKLIAANPNAGFARFIYAITQLFLFPFTGLTINPSFEGMVLEISSLIAMIVYAIAAWAVVQALWLIFFRTHTSSVSTYRRVQHR